MQTILKPALLAAAIGAAFLATQASHAEAPAAPVTLQRHVAAFSAIELAGPYDVVVRAQGRQALTLSGERQQLDGIETVVRGDTLVVRPLQRNGFQFSWGKRRERVLIQITASQLKSLAMSGSADVELARLAGERFSVSVDGPGDLQVAGAVRELAVRSSGSGDLDLQRLKAANVDLDMSGPGDVRLSGVGNQLTARIAGSGDLEANDVRLARLEARLSGPGGMTLSGSARALRAEISGSGDLEADRLQVKRATVKAGGPGGIALARVSDTLDAELHGSGGLEAELDGKRLLLKITGPGTAQLKGKVELVQARLSGSGSLEGRALGAGRADIAVTGPAHASVNVTGQETRRNAQHGQLLLVDRSGSRHAD